jgi:hypothetical protein
MQSIGIWGLREEARESWDHVVSDKIIYFSESVARNLKFPHSFAEKYIDGSAWFEMHLTAQEKGQRETHFHVIIEVAHVMLPQFDRSGEAEINHVAIHRDGPVLIHRPEFVQLPEGVVPVGIPSEVRLDAVEDSCHCGWKKVASIGVGTIVILEDEKSNIPLLLLSEDPLGVKVRQRPRQLLQCGSQAAQVVAEENGNNAATRSHVNPKDVEGFLKICVLPNGEIFRVAQPAIHFNLKRVEVKLRPTGFHLKFGQNVASADIHNAESLAESGQSSK